MKFLRRRLLIEFRPNPERLFGHSVRVFSEVFVNE